MTNADSPAATAVHDVPGHRLPAPGIDTIPAAALWARDTHAQRPALVSADRTLDFTAYVDRATDISRALLHAGVGVGDRVGIWAPNSIEFALCALGIHLSGAVLVPINTRFKAGEAAQILADADVRVLFTVDSFLGLRYADELVDHQDRLEGKRFDLPVIVTVDDQGDLPLTTWISEALPHIPVETALARAAAVGPDDIGTVLFTSGTTGRPKGAMLRHGALVRAYWTWSGLTGLRAGDRFLLSNPFFHAFGLKVGLLAALMRGAAVYPMAVFDPERALDLIENAEITYYPGPPTIYQAMLASPTRSSRDLTSLRTAVTGATSIPGGLIESITDDLGFDEIYIPYGFTEGTGDATITRHGDDRQVVTTTAGRALPDVTVRVLRKDGSQADAGEIGEIVVGGYNVMAGYLDPVTGTPRPADIDGFLHSGDLGCLDAAGNLVITGRSKDVVIVGGFNVYPAEVETCLISHPDVAAVSVIGAPDARLGEVPCAFVVPVRGSTVTAEALQTWCRERIANFKVPRLYHLVSDLPTNASGKVVKDELRALLGQRPASTMNSST